MRPFLNMAWPTLFALAVLSLSITLTHAFPRAPKNNEASYVPNSFIVELEPSATLSKRAISLESVLTSVLGQLSGQGIDAEIYKKYSGVTFSGAAITVADGVQQEDILALKQVKRVFRNRIYRLAPASAASWDSEGQAFLKLADGFLNALLAKLRSFLPSQSPYANDKYGPHVQTGVDKLHNSGSLGQGVKVCVIDGGLDYKNPILGGCFGPGCHTSFGYDFVGDNFSVTSNNAVQSPDPYSSCNDHGSHVQGIISALANQYGFTGVAPKANFGHYRIFGCLSDETTDDLILSALLRAQSDGCQVINLSVFGSVGWSSVTPSEIVLDGLVNAGIHVAVCAGNSGNEGMLLRLFQAAYPSSALNSVSVGSTDATTLPTYQAQLNGGRAPIAYMSPFPLPLNGSYPVVFTDPTGASTTDACSVLPADSLAGKVAVVRRGGCGFINKINVTAAAGAAVTLIYNTATDFMIPQLTVGTSGSRGVGGLTNEAGVQLLSHFNANPTGLQMSFPAGSLLPASSNVVGVKDKFSGGLTSSFSSYTPTFDMFGQPSVSAPGSNILSTVTMASGGVGILRGTSQASPLVAGAMALIISTRASERLTPFQVRSLLATTADRVPTTIGGSTPNNVVLQGGGSINVARAASAKTLLSPYQFALNDTSYANYAVTLTIENRNWYPVQYSLASIASQALAHYANVGCMLPLLRVTPHALSSVADVPLIPFINQSADQDVVPLTEPASVTATASASFNKKNLLLFSYQTSTVTITFSPPSLSAEQAARFPLFSGFITVDGRALALPWLGTESYTVPYFGLAAKMIDMPVLDTTDKAIGAFYPFLGLADGGIAQGGEAISMADGVTILFRLAGGTRSVTVDLVTADTAVNATVPSITNPMRRLVRPRSKRTAFDAVTAGPVMLKRDSSTLYSAVPTVGRIYTNLEAPRDTLVSLTDTEYLWKGAYSDANNATQTATVNTPYRVLLRALRITADPTLESSYESWLSPEFTMTA
ncbi:BZ3500_MvSof-1268-A1-R1_Chr2-1g04189 [Microbotryum saponariae]|uniref:BZ3500_MvSof-1268-A1-R1_Chr2-1g04189 protein n=1 Tax=Microbotryum saponariae TaxID=289078 RepID=A0A2X0M1U6_9BASI|nr:BZ3500_MvSof-1268-A1-R1_Chr2-1g04189 [Microbotryum saponariae]SCZ91176.1 BZ3501_MvSof-1269-A2-R1_Chr2-1g03845 [Microbotryum saponariae]